MSFQGYLRSIEATTGLTPADFRVKAETRGLTTGGQLGAEVTATQVVDWLRTEFGLGHGHAMAIYALLKGTKTEHDE